MVTVPNLNWIAGIVEGEGCIQGVGRQGSPCIVVRMTDKDIIERLSKYWKISYYTYNREKENNRKTQYCAQIFGKKAISWMFTLYTMLGIRRRSKIEEVIAAWKIKPGRGGWQKEFWRKRKEAASAKQRASGGVAKSSGNGSSKGSSK